MFPNITVQVTRAGVQIYNNIPVQLDTAADSESAWYSGVAPNYRFRGFILGNQQINHRDLLIDLNNIDPDTNTYKRYRVLNTPSDDMFQDFHLELYLERVVGT